MTQKDYRVTIRRLQAILVKIDTNQPVFFNLPHFQNMCLVKEHGKNSDNTTRWILTPKAKSFLTIVVV